MKEYPTIAVKSSTKLKSTHTAGHNRAAFVGRSSLESIVLISSLSSRTDLVPLGSDVCTRGQPRRPNKKTNKKKTNKKTKQEDQEDQEDQQEQEQELGAGIALPVEVDPRRAGQHDGHRVVCELPVPGEPSAVGDGQLAAAAGPAVFTAAAPRPMASVFGGTAVESASERQCSPPHAAAPRPKASVCGRLAADLPTILCEGGACATK